MSRDSFWQQPLAIDFVLEIDTPDPAWEPSLRLITYACHGASSGGTLRGVMVMDQDQQAKIFDSTPVRKFFVEEPIETISYYLYADNVALGARARQPNRNGQPSASGKPPLYMATKGEATIGDSGCNCAERFLPYPLAPGLLTDRLQRLEDVSCVATNFNGEHCQLVSGRPREGPPGTEWRILLKMAGGLWLPVNTDMYLRSELLSSTKTTFNTAMNYYLPTRVVAQALRSNEVVCTLTWKNISVTRGGVLDKGLSTIESVPPNLIVNDHRPARPVSYIMGRRPPTEQELAQMASSKEAVRAYQMETQVSPFEQAAAASDMHRPRGFVALFAAIALLGPMLAWIWLRGRGKGLTPRRS